MKRKLLVIILTLVAVASFVFGFSACKEKLSKIEKAGESTVIETTLSPNEIENPEDVIYAFVGKLRDFSTYQVNATGATTASIVTQTIETETIKNGDEFYSSYYSDSTFVHTEHLSFFKDDKVVYNANSLKATNLYVATKEDYIKTYGVTPCDVGIFGYVINKDTVRYVEKSYTQSGVSTYRLVLDGNTAGANMRIQMLQLGSLSDYPSFTSLSMLISIKEDWTPTKITLQATYTVDYPIIGDVSCSQSLVYLFTNVNSRVAIPETQTFNSKIGSTPSEVITKKNSTFDKIASMLFSNGFSAKVQLYTELLHNAQGEGQNNDPITLDLDVYAKYDSVAFNNDQFAKCLKFRIDLTLSENIVPLLSDFSSFVPDEYAQYLQVLAYGNTISIFNDELGNLYIVTLYKGNLTNIVLSLPLGDSVFEALFDTIDEYIATFEESYDPTMFNIQSITNYLTATIASAIQEQGNEDVYLVASDYVTYLINCSYKYALDSIVKSIVSESMGEQESPELYEQMYQLFTGVFNSLFGAEITGADLVIDFEDQQFSQAYIEIFGIPQDLSTTTLLKLSVINLPEIDDSIFTEFALPMMEFFQHYEEILTLDTLLLQASSTGIALEQDDQIINTLVALAKQAYLNDYAKFVPLIGYAVIFDGASFTNGLIVEGYYANKYVANRLLQLISLDEEGSLVYNAEDYAEIAMLWSNVTDTVFKTYLGEDLFDAADWEFGW